MKIVVKKESKYPLVDLKNIPRGEPFFVVGEGDRLFIKVEMTTDKHERVVCLTDGYEWEINPGARYYLPTSYSMSAEWCN